MFTTHSSVSQKYFVLLAHVYTLNVYFEIEKEQIDCILTLSKSSDYTNEADNRQTNGLIQRIHQVTFVRLFQAQARYFSCFQPYINSN